MRFSITSSAGVPMGAYTADTAEQAWAAMCADAGYVNPGAEPYLCGAPADWRIDIEGD